MKPLIAFVLFLSYSSAHADFKCLPSTFKGTGSEPVVKVSLTQAYALWKCPGVSEVQVLFADLNQQTPEMREAMYGFRNNAHTSYLNELITKYGTIDVNSPSIKAVWSEGLKQF